MVKIIFHLFKFRQQTLKEARTMKLKIS